MGYLMMSAEVAVANWDCLVPPVAAMSCNHAQGHGRPGVQCSKRLCRARGACIRIWLATVMQCSQYQQPRHAVDETVKVQPRLLDNLQLLFVLMNMCIAHSSTVLKASRPLVQERPCHRNMLAHTSGRTHTHRLSTDLGLLFGSARD